VWPDEFRIECAAARLVAVRLRARAGQNLPYSFFKRGARLRTDEMTDDASVAPVENGFRHRASPGRIHAAIESIDIDARLLAIVGKAGLIAREKAANEIHICVIVETDTENREADCDSGSERTLA